MACYDFPLVHLIKPLERAGHEDITSLRLPNRRRVSLVVMPHARSLDVSDTCFMRDIETIIEQMRAAHPAVQVEQLKVKFPGADDDGLWFFTHLNCPFEVQLESSTGMYPFLVETDENDERVYVHNINEALAALTKKLHL